MKHLTAAQTAKIVRTVLKEAFPKTKFSVRSKSYSMGASINIYWTDGPTAKQVDEFTDKLEGATFDGMTDYKGGRVHQVNGEEVHFGADFIFTNRKCSDAVIESAMKNIISKYFTEDPGVTVDDFYQGRTWSMQPQADSPNDHNLQTLTHRALMEMSFEETGECKALDNVELARTY